MTISVYINKYVSKQSVISLQVRSTTDNEAQRNPLRLVSQLSRIAAYQIEDTNWADTGCNEYPLYSFLAPNPDDCCPTSTDCTGFLLDNHMGIFDTNFYVGAIDLTATPLTVQNADTIIPQLLTTDPFLFMTGQPGDTTTPNPTALAVPVDKLGLGVTPAGDRLVLITNPTSSTVDTYTFCPVVEFPVITDPPTETGDTHTGTGQESTHTGTGQESTRDSGASNLGVGSVALGVVGVAYLNL